MATAAAGGPGPHQLADLRQAAEILKVPQGKVEEWLLAGKLTRHRRNGRVFCDRRELAKGLRAIQDGRAVGAADRPETPPKTPAPPESATPPQAPTPGGPHRRRN